MSKFLSQLKSSLGRRRLYAGLLALGLSLTTILTPQAGHAISVFELLIRGAQIYEASNISDEKEMAYGANINQGILQQVRIHPSRELNTYINNIGQQLARSSARPNIRYTFQVVDDDAINAFATMGGYVYINSGLIKAADNEAQLAGVIGHEIGHISGRHVIEQFKQSLIAQGISSIAGISQSQVAQLGVELALTRPNSREHEYDADRRGLENVIKTGYSPVGMPDFMKKLITSNSQPTFLSTHPAPADRVTRLQQMIPAEYQAKRVGMDSLPYRQKVSYFFNGTPIPAPRQTITNSPSVTPVQRTRRTRYRYRTR
jgi:beta-barrel assembly-enhancing protease